jgi:CRP-like cAMP-binding protein
MRVLHDLQRSYQRCWTAQMTKRCAQMLLKHESIGIIHLYETGMLDESEYSHICELIENKMFTLEYGTVQLPTDQKKAIEKAFDLVSLFRRLSDNEKLHWKSIMKLKHKWFQPGAVLLEKYQTVSNAYLIIRGIVECKVDTVSTYYMSGNIVGIDALFSETELSQSQERYSASSGLVESYVIDSDLLDTLLADDKMSREIYIETALHMLINNYQPRFKQNHSQLKLLLDEKAILSRNQPDLIINLKANERLFLLAGTLISSSDQKDIYLDSPSFVLLDSPTTYHLNLSSIVFTWTEEDEISYLNVKNCKRTSPLENSQFNSVDISYPHYSGETIEFTPRRQSAHVTSSIENLSRLQFIPSEIRVNNVPTCLLELPKI